MAFVYDASKYAWRVGSASVSSGLYNPFTFVNRQAKNFTLDAVVSMYKPTGPMPNDSFLQSFLCDAQVFEVANREDVYSRAYRAQAATVLGRWREQEDLLIAVDPVYPSVAFLRGTIGVPDVATDVLQFTSGGVAPIATSYIKKCKEFLQKNPTVDTVIAHSLGGHVANAATFGLENVKTVGLDAARILDIQYAYYQKSSWFESPSKTTNRLLQYAYTRNINSNSYISTGPSTTTGHQRCNNRIRIRRTSVTPPTCSTTSMNINSMCPPTPTWPQGSVMVWFDRE
jgi:hypothetical protein